ncbi:MAG: site-2 protease family protein, partial [Pseudomonadota bacterium]|nr:site-2 protease family protein [Pseudomonadota bacterium]
MPDFLVQTLAILKGNVVPALIVLTVVVFVHEMGHFLIARWCGIRVAAFSIGFGRELAGFTDRRGTRWKLSAIPLGGYVRFEGDENAASFPDPETLARTPPAERRGLFHFAPVWKRAAVVAAGPVANFILAILVFAAVFTLLGRPHILPVAETVISGSAAERAGLRPGDRILAVDGSEIDSFSELQSIVMLSADDPLEVVVDRGGERVL